MAQGVLLQRSLVVENECGVQPSTSDWRRWGESKPIRGRAGRAAQRANSREARALGKSPESGRGEQGHHMTPGGVAGAISDHFGRSSVRSKADLLTSRWSTVLSHSVSRELSR